MKKVIIYPGRFQPMLSHHAQVFEQLNALYNDADVYIATSDKVEPGKSPFNFEEKKRIIASHGIDPSKVLYARSPYNWEELAQYVSDVENTVIYFAVGEKDMESSPRFRFDNLDDKGINQKIKGGATYYQMINTYKDEPLPMNVRGYILSVPTISTEEEVASASAFRKAISTAPDKESAKLIFNKQFKQFNNDVFELVYNKLKGDKMSEDLNIMKKLAGLEVSEAGPIEFEDQVSVKDITFAEVSKSSSKLSVANRFPQGVDVNDMDVKKEQFVKELMKSPVSLLSEINERIMPDENGLAVSTKLSKILDGMREKGITDLEAEDKGFVMDLVKHALKNMELEAGDKREFDPESGALESVELNDIRSDYDVAEVKEKYQYENTAEKLKDMIRSHQSTIDNEHPEEIQVDDHQNAIDWYEDLLQQHKETGADTFEAPFGGDTAWREMIQQEMEEIGLYKPAEAFRGIDNLPEEVDESRENCHSKTHDCATKVIHPTWGEGKPMYESHAVPTNEGYVAWYDVEFDHGIEKEVPAQDMEIITLAEHGAVNASKKTSACPKCGKEKHVLKACASCGCSEGVEDDAGEYTYTLEYNGESNGHTKHILTITSPSGESKEVADDFTYFEHEEEDMQAELESWFKQGHGVGDESAEVEEADDTGMYNQKGPNYDASDIWRGDVITCKQCKGKGCKHCDHKGVHVKKDSPFYKKEATEELNDLRKRAGLEVREVGMDENKVKDMAMDQADAFYDKVSSIADQSNDIQKAIIDSWNDEDENPPVWALDDAAKDILADAGLLEPEPEEGEMEESEIAEANCPKCGEKRHKLKACASCGCSESFDPAMEPTKKEEIASNIMDGDFETAGALLGSDGASVMDDWYEYCRERGLDVKDAIEDIDHVENCVDEMIAGGEDKDYPAEMESIEEQEDAVVGKALDSAMVELKKLAGLY